MSDVNVETLPPLGFLDLWTRAMAARLLALAPAHPSLLVLARPVFGDAVDDPMALREALDRLEATLLGALPTRPQDPMTRLCGAYGLSAFELDLLVLSMLPELDGRLGDLFGGLRAAPGMRRPTVGLAVSALTGGREGLTLTAWMEGSPLWRHGLLRRPDPETPLADRELRPSVALRAGLLGTRPTRLAGDRSLSELAPDPDLPLLLQTRPSLAEAVEGIVAWGAGLVQVMSPDRGLARLVPEAVARHLGRPLLGLSGLGVGDAEAVQDAAIAAWLSGALLVLEPDRDTRTLALPQDLSAPSLVFVLSDPGVEVVSGLPLRRLSAPAPRPAEQAALWRHTLGPQRDAVGVDLVAVQTRVAPATVREAVSLAKARAGDLPLTEAHLQAALAEVCPTPGSGLAERSRPSVTWADLVLPERSRATLDELYQRVRYRVTVVDGWGMRGPDGRGDGLIALLHGESGTGKTLAAEVLAAALGLPMLRIDLSRVISKYIGETEKNLASVFDSAEGFRALLFFDEADALFSRRTAVKDAHDRYANVETNYLLQRLEVFEGVSVLASNRLQDLDEAFLRRIPFVIALPRPDRAHQRLLWERHLPPAVRGPDLDLDALVRRFDLVGGEVRSAAVTAAYAAARAGGQVEQAQAVEAARRELAKKGRVEG